MNFSCSDLDMVANSDCMTQEYEDEISLLFLSTIHMHFVSLVYGTFGIREEFYRSCLPEGNMLPST